MRAQVDAAEILAPAKSVETDRCLLLGVRFAVSEDVRDSFVRRFDAMGIELRRIIDRCQEALASQDERRSGEVLPAGEYVVTSRGDLKRVADLDLDEAKYALVVMREGVRRAQESASKWRALAELNAAPVWRCWLCRFLLAWDRVRTEGRG